MSEFRKFKRKSISEMRPFLDGEVLDLAVVSISTADQNAGSPKVGDMIARNPKNHGDQWLVAKEYFEDNLEEIKELPTSPGPYGGLHLDRGTFGQALQALKNGKKVCRRGWNGKDMYLYIVPENKFPSLTEHAKAQFGEETPYRAYFALKTAQNDIAMWSPSGSDALAADWCIVE